MYRRHHDHLSCSMSLSSISETNLTEGAILDPNNDNDHDDLDHSTRHQIVIEAGQLESEGSNRFHECDDEQNLTRQGGTNALHSSTTMDRNATMYLLKLKEVHHLSQSAIDCVVSNTRALLEQQLALLKEGIGTSLLASEDIQTNMFQNVEDPFVHLNTAYLQEKYFREKFDLVVS